MNRDPMEEVSERETPQFERISLQIRVFLSGQNNSKIARVAIEVLNLEETLKDIEIEYERKSVEKNEYSFIENKIGMSNDFLGLHTAEDCEAEYEQDAETCRRKRTRREKAICWAGAATKYAACLASSEEAIVCYCIAAAAVVSQLDGPALGPADAVACAILSAGGIIKK